MHVWPIESYIELTLFAPFCDSLAFLFIYLFLLHVRQACTLLFIRRFIFKKIFVRLILGANYSHVPKILFLWH